MGTHFKKPLWSTKPLLVTWTVALCILMNTSLCWGGKQPTSRGTEAPLVLTLPDLVLGFSSPLCSSVSFPRILHNITVKNV